MQQRRLGLACVLASVLAVGVPSAASADATVRANTAKTNAALTELKGQLDSLGQQVGELKTKTDGLAFVAAAAPQIVDGLLQLKTGLETLASAYQAVEYGIAQVNVYGGGGAIVNPPSWSGDIPDDGNGASTSGTTTFVNTSPSPRAVTLSLNAYIRSNEADVNGDNGPVGQAGGTLTVRDSGGNWVLCTNQGATGGIAVTLPGEPINTPDGAKRDLPLTNIVHGKSRTDQTLPGGDAPQLTSCSFTATAGGLYTAEWTASFLDIPTTTSPGPRD
ncbi:MAG TPA: hypothetical protein VFR97_04325 [Capillimicrobium sp.]|nr:hypothetical protein [Capillimicrobium sp.]